MVTIAINGTVLTANSLVRYWDSFGHAIAYLDSLDLGSDSVSLTNIMTGSSFVFQGSLFGGQS